MRIAGQKPNTFPMVVTDSRNIAAGQPVVVEGCRYMVVGVDDGTNTLFVKPMGKRKERRAAIRKTFK
jgi:hypothetical protein